jgi:hypothetical protein
MLRQPARLLHNNQTLTDFNFTLDYKGQEVLVRNGMVPEETIAYLEQALKTGDVLKLSGFQARTGAARHIICTEQGLPAIDSKIDINAIKKIDVLKNASKKMIRFTVSESEILRLSKQLSETPGVFFQYGDIDLTWENIHLEVRSDDPKPPLRPSTEALSRQTPVQKTVFTLLVSPNPTHEQAVIAFESAQTVPGRLSISNALGQIVYTQEIAIQAGENTHTVRADALKHKGVFYAIVEMPGMSGSAMFVVE